MTTTITSKGQVTIPKPVRNKLKLHAGDRLDLSVESDGSVRSVPVTSSIRHQGIKGTVAGAKADTQSG